MFFSFKTVLTLSATTPAVKVKTVLKEKNILSKNKKAKHHFYVSDFTKSFEESTRYFFKNKIHLEKVDFWK